MRRFVYITRATVLVLALLALVPVARLGVDWYRVQRVLTDADMSLSGHGFDWVVWQEQDGIISAAYVHPRGPADEAGLEAGDVFFMLDYQQFFDVEALKGAVEGIQPGTVHTYSVQRGTEIVETDVRFTRYPTFLYPLSGTLWQFSIWGFLLGAFSHIMGFLIVGPLAMRSRQARWSLVLILVSSLWIFANLLRLLMVELVGPPLTPGSLYDEVFQGLSFVGLIGWIGFPVLLLQHVLADVRRFVRQPLGSVVLVIYAPALVLGVAALAATLWGQFGPLTLDGLVAPILFYACCYIAAAAVLVHVLYRVAPDGTELLPGGWSTHGSALVFVVALFFALSVLGIVPIFGAVTDATAGWLIVCAQLLSIAPVVLVLHATLQHGKVDRVLSRSLASVTVFVLFFFAAVGGLSIIDSFVRHFGAPRNILAALYAVLLLVAFERLARRTHGFAAALFATDRQHMYTALSRFQEQMRTILSVEALARQTTAVVGRTFKARSAVLFLRAPDGGDGWVTSAYHPEPPYVTQRDAERVWTEVAGEGGIWARNPELNESGLSTGLDALLRARGVALLIPIMGEEAPIGLIALGMKKKRRTVYNLEEVDLLRSLCGQLALAVARLQLVEREKELVRQSAEAQLVALRAQINPHFLFNALNTIVALIEERPDQAEETVEHLAALFRHILQTGGQPFVSLEDELDLVDHYLSIEQVRFGTKLTVERHVERSLRTVPVPAFAVQTLVENAVKHGLARRRGGGTLRIICRRTDRGFAEIVVADTGVGIPALFDEGDGAAGDRSFFGIGLRNVSARLEHLYGRGDLLRIESTPSTGTTARLLLPPAQAPAVTPAGSLSTEEGNA